MYDRQLGLVSVVVTNYNKGAFLEECLEGIYGQTYDKWELIVIDDASTDDSWSRIEQWRRKRQADLREGQSVTALRLPRNTGYAGAMTIGMFLARGEFIAVHDSDDVSHPDRLQRQTAYLHDHPSVQLLGTNYAVFQQRREGNLPTAGWIRYGEQIRKVYAGGGHCVCHGTIMFRGALFDRLGGHTRKMEGAEDYEFIAKCLQAGKDAVENLKEVLYFYRKHPDQRSRQYFGQDRTEPPHE